MLLSVRHPRKKKQLQDLLEARRSTKSLDEQIEGLEGFIERKKKALLKQEELVVSNVAQAKVHKEAADAAAATVRAAADFTIFLDAAAPARARSGFCREDKKTKSAQIL